MDKIYLVCMGSVNLVKFLFGQFSLDFHKNTKTIRKQKTKWNIKLQRNKKSVTHGESVDTGSGRVLDRTGVMDESDQSAAPATVTTSRCVPNLVSACSVPRILSKKRPFLTFILFWTFCYIFNLRPRVCCPTWLRIPGEASAAKCIFPLFCPRH